MTFVVRSTSVHKPHYKKKKKKRRKECVAATKSPKIWKEKKIKIKTNNFFYFLEKFGFVFYLTLTIVYACNVMNLQKMKCTLLWVIFSVLFFLLTFMVLMTMIYITCKFHWSLIIPVERPIHYVYSKCIFMNET